MSVLKVMDDYGSGGYQTQRAEVFENLYRKIKDCTDSGKGNIPLKDIK
jgi:hypothetical protein